jgi:nitrate reductase beta subunit
MPMVWYVPPLSPVEKMVDPTGGELDPERLFATVEEMRIPLEYLASFMTAGDTEPVRRSLARLAAMRRFMRAANVDGRVDTAVAADVGMEPAEIEEMFRMVAIGDYDERYVIPKRQGEEAEGAFGRQGSVGLDFSGCSVTVAPAAANEEGIENYDSPAAAADFDLRDGLVQRRGGADA